MPTSQSHLSRFVFLSLLLSHISRDKNKSHFFSGDDYQSGLSPSPPQELDAFQPYPVEIVPGKIYLGNFRQACDPKIQKDLKIKAHVNVSMETGPL